MNRKISKITLCAILSALSTLAFLIESLFPPIILPGTKLGLSNVFILLSSLILGVKYGFITLVVKILIGSLFSGNLSSIMYSLPAGIISLSIQCVLLFVVKKVSIIASSIAGAVINVTVQNFIFCLVTDAFEYLFYLPYLALISVLSGLTVGFAVYLTVKKLPLFKRLNYRRT